MPFGTLLIVEGTTLTNQIDTKNSLDDDNIKGYPDSSEWPFQSLCGASEHILDGNSQKVQVPKSKTYSVNSQSSPF